MIDDLKIKCPFCEEYNVIKKIIYSMYIDGTIIAQCLKCNKKFKIIVKAEKI